MKLFRKTTTAVLVFVLTVILSILFSGHMKLSSEANQVLDIFYEGERKDGLSIYTDLKDLVDASRNIVSLSQKFMDPSAVELTSLNDAISDFSSADSPAEYYEIYSRIVANMDDVSALFVIYCDDDAAMKLFEDSAAVFASKMNTISYDPYNRYVREYNKLLEQFPAKVIAKLTGVKEVSAFE